MGCLYRMNKNEIGQWPDPKGFPLKRISAKESTPVAGPNIRYKDVCKRDMKALGILTAVNGKHWLQNIQLGGRQCSFRPFQVSKDTLPNRLKQKDN